MSLTQKIQNHKDAFYPEQVKLLYDSFRISAIGTVVAAIIFLNITLQYSAITDYVYIWFGAIFFVTILRSTIWFIYFKSSPVKNYKFWDKLFFAGVIASSLAWSCIGFFSLTDQSEKYLILIFLMLMGVNSFAVTTLAYIKQYMYLFYIITVSPFFIIQIIDGDFFSYIIFAVFMLFTVLIFSSTKRLYQFFEQNFCLQREAEVKNEELTAAYKAKSSFLSRMSHELRTPLTAINGYSELLLLNSDKNLNEEQSEHIETILSSGEHLLSLINEILDHAKIESGKMEVNFEPTDPLYIMYSCIPMIENLAKKRGISIDIKLDDLTSLKINADQQKLKQIFLNLLSNAVKYNNENGHIIIEGKISNTNELEIGVIDTGNGLSEEQQANLFLPFERISKDAGEVEGTGLGLVICKQLTNLMGGKIRVLSKLGEGTQFWVKFLILDDE